TPPPTKPTWTTKFTKKTAAKTPAKSKKKATKFNSTAVTPKTKAAKSKKVVKSIKPASPKRKFTPPRVPYAALAAAPTPAYNPHDHEPLTQAQLRKIKTGLVAKDLRYFRQQLLERRAEIIGDVQGLEASRTGSSGDISHMPLHMADVGSDNYEQEFTLGLMEYERKIIIEIDEALKRIENKTYGVCVESGQPIGRPRLEAKPWAKYCIDVARERERRGLK
ncbi:MAG: TraR/DksA family transcriptional regulator, partial [Planctomycetota bacterium]